MSREIAGFQEIVWDYYANHRRDLPWREPEADGSFDPYKILVSEIMLQQTQAARVIPKYRAFLERFSTIQTLAAAPLSAVLAEWNGLGYNRRAKFLHDAAKQLTAKTGTWTFEDLVQCKGIGPNTAAAVLTYAYNRPLLFIETNIRTVFIHHFFQNRTDVSDKEILPLIEKTLLVDKGKKQDRFAESEGEFISPGPMRKTVGLSHYREWYWALMDYGVYLKATIGNVSKFSKHYTKQSTFTGSKRQVRGQVLRLLKEMSVSRAELDQQIPDERLDTVLADLLRERLITQKSDTFHLG